jgi:phosphoenolpyruvate synthase/pyruvate phosphate dikinase
MEGILFFEKIRMTDFAGVGLVKIVSLGEMYNHLNPRGITVLDGFAITADLYRSF